MHSQVHAQDPTDREATGMSNVYGRVCDVLTERVSTLNVNFFEIDGH